MELIVFIAFLLLMEVQSYESPTVKVSPDVIRESSSVKISCETPADVTVNQCYFIINREEKNIKVSSSCELDLSGAEVFRLAAVKSHGSLNIYCYYTTQGIDKPSPHSPPATVSVLESPTVKVSPDVIRESSSVKISCEMPPGAPVNQCNFYINREEKNIKSSWKCELDLSGAEVLGWAAVKSPESLNIYCYYTIRDKPSPHSPPATVTVRVSTSATTEQTTTTAMKTSLPVMSTSETITYSTTDLHSKTNLSTSTTKEITISITNSTLPGNSRTSEHISTETSTQKASQIDTFSISTTMAITFTTTSPRTAVSSVHTSMAHPDPQRDIWFIVLVSTAVAVILSGLTGLICLCWFASKKRRKQLIKTEVSSQGIGMSCSGSVEIYSLITSVPETSQPISGGLEHPESHQDSTADPTDTHSFIMSVNSIYQPSDVLVNEQQKRGSPEENENVYHLYSTIPDKPVHSNAEDHVYSLLKMN